MTLLLPELFASRGQFAGWFVEGLTGLLKREAPEARHAVLAHNNAVAIGHSGLLCAALDAARVVLAHPPTGSDADEPDDRRILAQALAESTPRIVVTRTPAGRFIVDNPLRRQRPPRAAANRPASHRTTPKLWRPFDASAFSFQRLPEEYMADVQWCGHTIRLYYNKYPSGPWHLSVVPEPVAGHPQYLAGRWVELAMAMADAAHTGGMPEMVVVYNSLLARASINHCHFQLLEVPGLDPTAHLAAAGCTLPQLAASEEVWRETNYLQRISQPFNLLVTNNAVVVPRQPQGVVAEPAWTSGFAALELGGYVMVVRPDGHTVSDAEINALVQSLVVYPPAWR